MKKINNWKATGNGNYVLNNTKGKVYLSYRPNDEFRHLNLPNEFGKSIDSANPETAIVLINNKPSPFKEGELVNRYLIFRGDRRKELEAIYPNIEKLKRYWKKHGGHFWSDDIGDK